MQHFTEAVKVVPLRRYYPHSILQQPSSRKSHFDFLESLLWKLLQLVRVYTKPPGKKADRRDPFVLTAGATVLDLAARIHAELPEKLAYARVWGGKIDGQRVARDFELRDRDVVEIAT